MDLEEAGEYVASQVNVRKKVPLPKRLETNVNGSLEAILEYLRGYGVSVSAHYFPGYNNWAVGLELGYGGSSAAGFQPANLTSRGCAKTMKAALAIALREYNVTADKITKEIRKRIKSNQSKEAVKPPKKKATKKKAVKKKATKKKSTEVWGAA